MTTKIANLIPLKAISLVNKDTLLCPETLKNIDPEIKVATTEKEINMIKAFRAKYYRLLYPETFKQQFDPYYKDSYHFYLTDHKEKILGTVTIALDNPDGLPSETIFDNDINELRQSNLTCVEVGRFLIAKHSAHEQTQKRFYRFLYLFSQAFKVDVIVAMFKEKEIEFLENIIGAAILCKDTGKNFGSKNYYVSASWHLAKTNENFYHWANCEKKLDNNLQDKPIFSVDDWNEYAEVFSSVQTSFQRDVQQSSIRYLQGNVADFGCGSAKLAPFLADIPEIVSYTGLDYSEAMVKVAAKIMAQFANEKFTVVRSKIEEYSDKKFDSGVSINSYQSWPNPIATLKHIYSLLEDGAKFVLASPNNHQNILKLAKEADKELIAHPDYTKFKELNLILASNSNANFPSMNTLIQQVQAVGFNILSCHQKFYLGGLNFIVMEKIK